MQARGGWERGLSLLPGNTVEESMKCREDVRVEGRQPASKVLRQFVPRGKTPGFMDESRDFTVCTHMCTLRLDGCSFCR